MSNLSLPETSEIFVPDLQTASDIFFVERARHSVPGMIAEFALVDYPIINREPDDPTLLENKFFPADIDNQPYAEHAFLRKVGNLKEVVGTLNKATKEYGLEEYPEITAIMPHLVMQDAVTIPMLIGQSRLGEGRTVEDNYIIISRLIPYIQYLNPLRRVISPIVSSEPISRLIPYIKYLNPLRLVVSPFDPNEPINSFERHVRPMGNILQIFPETESTKPLFEVYASDIGRYNVRAIKEMEEHKKVQKIKGNQQIVFVPPSASRTKSVGHGRDKHYDIEYVSGNTVKRLYNDHKRGKPIWPIGINYNPNFIYMPGFPPQNIRLDCVKPIMPKDQPLHEEVFEKLLMSKILESAKSVTHSVVSQKPRPQS